MADDTTSYEDILYEVKDGAEASDAAPATYR